MSWLSIVEKENLEISHPMMSWNIFHILNTVFCVIYGIQVNLRPFWQRGYLNIKTNVSWNAVQVNSDPAIDCSSYCLWKYVARSPFLLLSACDILHELHSVGSNPAVKTAVN